MRVAFFGGTFDPIHRGHLAIAAAAAEQLGLDTILFAPTGRQPLKPERATAPFKDRLAMTALACLYASEDVSSSVPAKVSSLATDLDAPRTDGAPNYTVDVLDELHRQLPDATLFSLAGVDSFLTLPRWHAPARLFDLAEWIVVSRPGYTLSAGTLAAFSAQQRTRIHLIHSVHEDVSATELRHRLAQGDACPDLIPAPVAAYIEANGLYRPSPHAKTRCDLQ